MSQSIEIEFKSLLPKTAYDKLCQHYQLVEADFITQTNVYYDTVNGQLKDLQTGLRIRLYQDTAEATLKTPLETGLLETTDQLTLKKAQQFVKQGKFLTEGNVAAKLNELGIDPAELTVIAELTTKRAEFEIPEGLLAIDESWYGSKHDYELELEVKDYEIGKVAFEKLLADFQINYQPALNKIQRAVAEKN